MSGIVQGNLDRVSGVVDETPAGPTISASDPTISTDATLGTQWANSSSGEFYVLTDATADANVWTNVGGGSGDIEPWVFHGSISGYTCSNNDISNGDIIDKFSLSSDANATDVGNLTVARMDPMEACGSTHG